MKIIPRSKIRFYLPIFLPLLILLSACSSVTDGDESAVATDSEYTTAAASSNITDETQNQAPNQNIDMSIEISSTAFNRIRRIGIKYACPSSKTNPNVPGGVQFGGNQSPPLAWSNMPEGTVSFALIMEGKEPRIDETNIHWIIWNIPAEVAELSAAIPTTTSVVSIGPRTTQGTNDYDNVGYYGPCPAPFNLDSGSGNQGKMKSAQRAIASKYTFRIYALDTEIDLGSEATYEDFMASVHGHIIAGGEVVGERVGEYFRRITGN